MKNIGKNVYERRDPFSSIRKVGTGLGILFGLGIIAFNGIEQKVQNETDVDSVKYDSTKCNPVNYIESANYFDYRKE